MKFIFSLLWLFLIYSSILILILPAYIVFYIFTANSLSYLLIPLMLPAALLSGPFFLLLYFSFLTAIFPKLQEGYFIAFKDKGSVAWALANAPANLYLRGFQGTLFFHDGCRYWILKLLGCSVEKTSWVTSKTTLRDIQLITLGHNVVLAEEVRIAPSLIDADSRLLIERISIGNNSLLSTYTIVGPGAKIGENTTILFGVKISPKVKIGNHVHISADAILGPSIQIQDHVKIKYGVKIGALVTIGENTTIGETTAIDFRCKIGKNVKIGKNCLISEGTVIPDGETIDNNTII